MLDHIIKHAEAEWNVLTGAPFAVLLLIAASVLIAWFLQEWRYGGVRDRIEARDEELQRLKMQPAGDGKSAAAAAAAAPEPRARREKSQPGGTPDTKLVPAFEYVFKQSSWARKHKATGLEVLQEMRDKLHLKELSAWGRRELNTPIELIPAEQWRALRLHTGTGSAMTEGGDTVWHGVQFDVYYLHTVWPPERV